MTSEIDHQQGSGEVVQTNRDGRVRYSREQRERILHLFEQSGMSGKAFAEKHGIKYPTFALWRRQRREAKQSSEEVGGAGFVLAELPPIAPSPGLSLVLPGGAEVRATGEVGVELLASLIRKLS